MCAYLGEMCSCLQVLLNQMDTFVFSSFSFMFLYTLIICTCCALTILIVEVPYMINIMHSTTGIEVQTLFQAVNISPPGLVDGKVSYTV